MRMFDKCTHNLTGESLSAVWWVWSTLRWVSGQRVGGAKLRVVAHHVQGHTRRTVRNGRLERAAEWREAVI